VVLLLFISRLALYTIAAALPIVHPAVVVPYDRPGWWLWFAVVPAEILIAFFLAPPRLKLVHWLLAAAAPIVLAVLLVTGLGPQALLYLAAAVAAFVLTALVFHGGALGRKIAFVEPFLLAAVYLKVISFSRASEAIARSATGLTQTILIVTLAAFMAHGLLLYLAAFRGQAGRRSEMFLLGGVFLPTLVLLAVLLPPDFIRHSVVLNILKPEPDPQPIPLDYEKDGKPGGNLRPRRPRMDQDGAGRDGRQGRQPGQAGQPNLEGVPADQWGQEGQGEGEGGKQRAVMIVASKHDPVYAADAYFGRLDAEAGFGRYDDEGLNGLRDERLLETWKDRGFNIDKSREPVEQLYLSTIPDRVMQYKPSSIEPTVLDRRPYPFNYNYRVISQVATPDSAAWQKAPELTDLEKQSLKEYLKVPLSQNDAEVFLGHLAALLRDGMGPWQRIDAILRGFGPDPANGRAGYQYEIGFTDDVSVQHMEDFLAKDKTGDCTEFSNATALLARVAGVPSRVVTGWLASSDLQTPAHVRGLLLLKERIPILKDIPIEELFLVTNAHRHSWVQVYLAEYGWIDLETTAYALPPPPGTGANDMDVVIPLIEERDFERQAPFPWLLLARVVGIVALVGVTVVYLYRYGSELVLGILARRRDRTGLRALYRLLLMKLAAEGYDVKVPSQTPLEYSGRYALLAEFAALYTRLSYRSRSDADDDLWARLRAAWTEAVDKARRKGPGGLLRRSFSLRGLYYQW
jgi:transglutaminase-like putative cysteine protease